MNARTLDNKHRRTIAKCGRMCEHSLRLAVRNADRGHAAGATRWRARAEWWSAEAFRQVSP